MAQRQLPSQLHIALDFYRVIHRLFWLLWRPGSSAVGERSSKLFTFHYRRTLLLPYGEIISARLLVTYSVASKTPGDSSLGFSANKSTGSVEC